MEACFADRVLVAVQACKQWRHEALHDCVLVDRPSQALTKVRATG